MVNGEHVIPPATNVRLTRRFSWGGVFSGLVAVLIIQLILLLLGAAIGLGVVGNQTSQNWHGFGIGAGIWWICTSIIAGFFGAMIAARMADVPNHGDGALNGLIGWAAAQLVALYVAATAIGSIFGGAGNILASSGAFNTAANQTYGYVAPEAQAQPAEAEGKAKAAATQASMGASDFAIWALVMLVLSGIAAALGGSAGTPESVFPEAYRDTGRPRTSA